MLTPELAAFVAGLPGSPEEQHVAGLGILERRLTTLLLLTAELGAQGPPNGLPLWVMNIGMPLVQIPVEERRGFCLKLARLGLHKAQILLDGWSLSPGIDPTERRRWLDRAEDLSSSELLMTMERERIEEGSRERTRDARIKQHLESPPPRPKRKYRRRRKKPKARKPLEVAP